ncbi:MAG: glutathione transferase GstA [Proteobacteria bacterium]|nr:glutathione transferase GstA [Pseudomonadota bacterium]
MKLYFSPGVCSLAPHIVAREIGLPLTLEKVDLKTKTTETGADFTKINPKGSAPALELDNGEVLTEGPAISQYLADLKPESGIAPPNGTLARARLQEMLNYITSEIHKTYSPFFSSTTPKETLVEREAYLRKRYRYIENILAQREWLVGDKFGPADAYLFVVTNWARGLKLDLTEFPALLAFQKRVAARPAVHAAMLAEGLVKA